MEEKKENGSVPAMIIPVLFFGILLFTGVISFIFGIGTGSENIENRNLADFPGAGIDELADFPSAFEDWLNDHAPFRDQWLNLYATINYEVFDSVDNDLVITGKDGWLFFTGDDTLDGIYGMKTYTETDKQHLLDLILEMRDTCCEDPENFVLFVAPDKENIYREYLPDCYPQRSTTSRSVELLEYIDEHSEINTVFPEEALREAAGGDIPLYYQCDTHWNSIGGFIASQELLKSLGLPAADISSLTISTDGTHKGDLATNVGHIPERLKSDPELTFSSYYDDADITVLIDDLDVTGLKKSVNKNAPDSRKLIFVCDSFGDGMDTTLSRYFSEVTCINSNMIPQISREEFDGDLLVYEIVERRFSAIPGDMLDMTAKALE